MNEVKSYAYVIERAEDGGYWAYLPDLPGCTTTAETPEEVEQLLPAVCVPYLSVRRQPFPIRAPGHARRTVSLALRV